MPKECPTATQMADNKILARHPDPEKQGVSIDAEKYHMIKDAILSAVENAGELGFTDLIDEVDASIGDQFDGSIPWYVTTVKLDLEARGLLERVPRASPQRLVLSERS